MSVWTTKVDSVTTIAAAHINDLQTEKVDRDGAIPFTAAPTAPTIKLTSLTDGYVPYHVSDATGLANSPLSITSTNGLRVASNASSTEAFAYTDNTYYSLRGGYQASGVGYFGGLVGSSLALWAGGSERLRVNLSGNIGIGLTTFGTSAEKVLAISTGVAPSTSPADAFQLYSADQTAGNACPHFRTEGGAVVKLYKYVDDDASNTPNSGDADTDDLIDAMRDALVAFGLLAAS